MVSRRQFLATVGLGCVPLAGCRTRDDPTGSATDAPTASSITTERPTGPSTDSPTENDEETPNDDSTEDVEAVGEWKPTWSLDVEFGRVLALTEADDDLYATLSGDEGRSAVGRLDPAGQTFDWQTQFPGKALTSTHLRQTNARDKWSLTLADGTLYVVTGETQTEGESWTGLHALDPATGDERWSLQRERELAVAGVQDGIVVAGGLEFFHPETTHDAPEEPLTTVIYGIDAASGDVRWTREFTAVDAATTAAGGVAVASVSGLTMLDLDGTERWSESTGRARTVVPVGEIVVAAVADGDGSRLRAFAPDGTERWQKGRMVDEFLADGDVLYGLGDETVAIGSNGTVAWHVDGYSQWPLLAPDGETLYARAAAMTNAVDAFSLPEGGRRFRYETPSNNGWPAGATDSMVVAEAITPEKADFTSLFAVDEQNGDPMAVYRPDDHVFDVAGLDGTAYASIDDRLFAFEHPN